MSKNPLLIRKQLFLAELVIIALISLGLLVGSIKQFSNLINLSLTPPTGIMGSLINQTLLVLSPVVPSLSQIELTTPLTSTYSDTIRR